MFIERVETIISQIKIDKELLDDAIFIFSNKSKSSKDETSLSICLNEGEYPRNQNMPPVKNKSAIILNMTSDFPVKLVIRKDLYLNIDIPSDFIFREIKSGKEGKDNMYSCVVNEESDSLYTFICSLIEYSIANYISSGKFACCSRFIDCSNKLKCVHENKLYSKGCYYRKNLELGKIFYGENKNI